MTKLVVFDYSGTLSLEAVRFGRPDRLQERLCACGLADLGIDATTYWRAIVAPTWQEASTTDTGFCLLMARRIHAAIPGPLPKNAVADAVHRFVDDYLQASVIDAGWQPALAAAADHPRALVVVATDHYPEATAAIIGHLHVLNLAAVPAARALRTGISRAIVVANSADMGYHKKDLPFWRKLAGELGAGTLTDILMVDDFGANEMDRSGYAAGEAIVRRKAETLRALHQAFAAPAAALTVGGDAPESIAQAVRSVLGFLAGA